MRFFISEGGKGERVHVIDNIKDFIFFHINGTNHVIIYIIQDPSILMFKHTSKSMRMLGVKVPIKSIDL